MKKTLFALAAILGAVNMADAKTLVAYYSRSGNTAELARLIQSTTDADIFEIKTADANYYPAEYTAMTEFAKKEIADGTLPSTNASPDLSQYDTIFVGTPIWWGTMATPVRAFLTNNSMSGKTVAPFATHGGGGSGTSFADIEKLANGATIKQGYAVYGATATADDVSKWLADAGLK